MQFGQLILTPGYECENENTDVYSVMALSTDAFKHIDEDNEDLFASPVVRGAIFFQHHMMCHDDLTDTIKNRDFNQVKKNIQAIKKINGKRASRDLPPLECIFDAEPCPVQKRRYYRNPPQWPNSTAAQAEHIVAMVHNDKLDSFLDNEVEKKGYFPLLPSNQDVGRIAEENHELGSVLANTIGKITGRAFATLGINVLFAPVCDLLSEAFEERCYSNKPEVVVACAQAWCLGALSQQGIDRICLKHAPGHGVAIQKSANGSCDTHSDKCHSHVELKELQIHMGVFAQITAALLEAGVKKSAISIMTNHITYTALDASNPASSSDKVIDFIKQALPCPDIDLIVDCVHMASFAKEKSLFLEKLDKARSLHEGGTIVTTHFVKKFTREEVVAYCEKNRGKSMATPVN